jgi:N-methylhydantoinase B
VFDPLTLFRGDLFRHHLAGAGGHGPALGRDPEAVLADVVLEKVTVRHALEAYGVVIVDSRPPRVDREATRRERAARRGGDGPVGAAT